MVLILQYPTVPTPFEILLESKSHQGVKSASPLLNPRLAT